MSEQPGPAVARERLRKRLRQLRQHQLTDAYQRFIGHEARASRICVYQGLFVPGLLQTDSYAYAITAAILQAEPADAAVVARVEIRMDRRQALLERMAEPDPPRLVAMIDEAVLRRPVGGGPVMREQLEHLVRMAGLPGITVVVIPLDLAGHPGLGGSFELLELTGPEEVDILFLEAPHDDFIVTDLDSTAATRTTVETLLGRGLTGDDANAAIRLISESLPT